MYTTLYIIVVDLLPVITISFKLIPPLVRIIDILYTLLNNYI